MVLDAMQVARVRCDGFIDDGFFTSWMGFHVQALTSIDFNEQVCLHLAIGNNKIRETIADKLRGTNFFNVLHPSVSIAQTSQIGLGTLVAAQAVVAPDTKVGVHCIINHSAVVDHDCTIGDFSHIAPQSILGGASQVGKGVLIGAGAVVLPGITIGDYAVIGAGSVVTKNVDAGTIVVGSPARIINK